MAPKRLGKKTSAAVATAAAAAAAAEAANAAAAGAAAPPGGGGAAGPLSINAPHLNQVRLAWESILANPILSTAVETISQARLCNRHCQCCFCLLLALLCRYVCSLFSFSSALFSLLLLLSLLLFLFFFVAPVAAAVAATFCPPCY
jgi:hypothetical protein